MLEFIYRHYYIVSLVVIVLSMLPFAVSFEGRKPQARELVVIAVLVAVTVAGRAAFFMVPQFKPVVALVIISGAALGPQSGFVVGALSGFVSNFIFGQGPWTPWQMFAFGMTGFLAGLFFSRLASDIGDGRPSPSDSKDPWNVRKRRRTERMRIALLCLFGFAATFALYGLILDTAATAIFSPSASRSMLLATYLSGAPFNLVHAVSTVIFLSLLARPMLEKLERVKKKYGLLAARDAAGARRSA
jgi:energy-coupling factor transport system substrate-specific component